MPLPGLSRRTFVQWTGSIAALLGLRPRNASGAAPDAASVAATDQPSVLDAALLLGLAEAVLPQELGASGIADVARAFSAWARGYKPGAELLHGYGTDRLSFAAPSPLPRWQAQLRGLNDAARNFGAASFNSASVDQRQHVVRAALSGQKLTTFPAPHAATHVALGLMAWYYESPDATDLCYRAGIGMNRCRPLALNPDEPAPLERGGAAPRGLLPEAHT